MRQSFLFIFAIVIIFGFAGCISAQKKTAEQESTDEIISAVGSMTEGLTNSEVSKEDLKRTAIQMQKDPEVRSAVEAVNKAFDIKDTGVKYCPKDGKRYSSRLEFCPIHKDTKLVPVD
jgi:hypothetical protein